LPTGEKRGKEKGEKEIAVSGWPSARREKPVSLHEREERANGHLFHCTTHQEKKGTTMTNVATYLATKEETLAMPTDLEREREAELHYRHRER